MTTTSSNVLLPRIEGRIQLLRGIKVMIDADLADLYGVPTKALNQAVKRNPTRFPSDFMFQLTAAEKAEVVSNCDHLAKLKFSRTLPYAFTEHGAIQAANVLASPQAVEMGIHVVRAFVQLRQASALHADLAKRLSGLEEKVELLEMRHDNFSQNTRTQLRQIFEVLRELTMPPDPPKRPIGFIAPEEKKPPKARSPRKPPT
ncbi:ORF6N domain-containing protein [Variovorax robiniae]|uniref:ORF6N domain-containing protein n=1 Tax=Variovorax robiniae TaxID=1836199 RepID=A0ABU8XAI2_9BURK